MERPAVGEGRVKAKRKEKRNGSEREEGSRKRVRKEKAKEIRKLICACLLEQISTQYSC